MSGSYTKLHLTKKNYVINNDNITVVDSLIVDAGVTVRLADNTSIVCLGAIAMNGLANNRIRFTSKRNQTGSGFVIATQANYELHFNYVTFDSLVLPILFADGWFRTEIEVKNSQFINNEGTSAVIQVLNPTIPAGDAVPITTLRLTHNLFANNIAPVKFEDLQSDNFKIEVTGNSFVENRISGSGKFTYSGNMLYGRMDKMQTRFKANIKGNSFVNNYLRDIDADTLIQQADMGIYGGADSLAVPANYWGDADEKVIRSRVYDYSTNLNSPKLVLTPIDPGPYDTLPPHIYDMSNTSRVRTGAAAKSSYRLVDSKWVPIIDTASPLPFNYNLRLGLRSFRMTANRPIRATNLTVHFVYLKDSVLNLVDSTFPVNGFRKDVQGPPNNNIITITFNTPLLVDSMFKTKPGYLVIKGMEGLQGEYVPNVYIGYESFLKYTYSKKSKLFGGGAGAGGAGANDGSSSQRKQPPEVITHYKKSFEYGLLAGNAIYYGTLSNKNLFANDYNSIFGFQFRYNKKKNLSFSLSVLSVTLTGSDLRSGDTAKINRGFSFKTPVTAFSIQAEYDFFDNMVFSTRYRLHPMFGFGIDYIKFNPMGEYLGKWYNLQPLGTGGQTIPYVPPATPSSTDVKPAPYALSSLGAPVTFQLRYYLNPRTIFSVFATYHLAFTNYLDDVGPDPYPDPTKLAAANAAGGPLVQAAAVYFSNPTNRYVRIGQTLRSGAADVSDGFFTFGFTLMVHHK